MRTLFILSFLVFNMVTAMGQLLDLGDRPVLLGKENGSIYYLTFVQKDENHYFFTKTGEPDINISYGLRIESENQLSYLVVGHSAQFIPDSSNRYKIIEISSAYNFYYRESVNHFWKDAGHSDPTGMGSFVGFSDDPSLWAVKALNYLHEHTIEPVIYESAQVEQQPVFMRGDTVVNFEKYIKNELWEVGTLKQTELASARLIEKIDFIDSLSGFVRFSFVVSEIGYISHITVEEINLNNLDAVPDVCVGINYHILTPSTQGYNNAKKYKWIPGEKNGVPVAVRQFVTVYFN